MSQPFHYSNMLFETDPNSLAAQLINIDAPPSATKRNPVTGASGLPYTSAIRGSSQSSSSFLPGGTENNNGKRLCSNRELEERANRLNNQTPLSSVYSSAHRPPPLFEGFSQSASQSLISRQQTSSTPSAAGGRWNKEQHTKATASVISPTWGLATTPHASQDYPLSQVRNLAPPQFTPSRLPSSQAQIQARPFPAPSSSGRHLSAPTDLLAEQIVPRSSSSSSQSLPQSLAGVATTSRTGAGGVLAASHASTFRAPRPAPVVAPPPITSFFNQRDSTPSNDDASFETSAWFEGGNSEGGAHSRQRVIPGPALDAWVTFDDPDTQGNRSTQSEERKKDKTSGEDAPKYGFGGMFSRGPWLAFCHAYNEPPVLEHDPDGTSRLQKFNCEGVLGKGLGNNAQKVPFLALVVLKIRYFEHFASASLADPTGVLEAEIHENVMKSDLWSIQEGAVLVLNQVTVCRPLFVGEETSTHTLIITTANVKQVFAPNEPVPKSMEQQVEMIANAQSQPRSAVRPPSNATSNTFSRTMQPHHVAPAAIPLSQQEPTAARTGPTLPSFIPMPSHIAPKRRVEDFGVDEDEFEMFLSNVEKQQQRAAAVRAREEQEEETERAVRMAEEVARASSQRSAASSSTPFQQAPHREPELPLSPATAVPQVSWMGDVNTLSSSSPGPVAAAVAAHPQQQQQHQQHTRNAWESPVVRNTSTIALSGDINVLAASPDDLPAASTVLNERRQATAASISMPSQEAPSQKGGFDDVGWLDD